MKIKSVFFALATLVAASPASASLIDDVLPWVEMSMACEVLVAAQSKELWSQYPETVPIDDTGALQQIAIRHPTENLVATAVGEKGSWVLCFVEATPALLSSDAGSLIYAWGSAQRALAHRPSYVPAMIPKLYQPWQGQADNPARVRCHAGKPIVAVFAYVSRDGAFRVVASKERPPGTAVNPCVPPPSSHQSDAD